MSFGISEKTMSEMFLILSKYDTIEQVSIFGSRAKGNFKPNSDIDLLIENDISSSLMAQLNAALLDSLIPYKVDLLQLKNISSEEMKDEILNNKRLFYKRSHQLV